MLQPREWTSLGVTARQLWPLSSERELSPAAPPAAICLDPVKPQEKPRAAAAAVTLPFLVLGERLAANYRDKERARQPDIFRKDAPSSRRARSKKRPEPRKRRALRAERIKTRVSLPRVMGPTLLALALVLGVLCALV